MPRRQAVHLTSPRSISTSSLFLALPALFTLTEEGSLEGSCEGCTFCTLLQNGKAHLLTFQPLPRSSQKHGGCHQRRFPVLSASAASSVRSVTSVFSVLNPSSGFTLPSFSCSIVQKSRVHPLFSQSFARSLQKRRVCHHQPFFNSSTLHPSTSSRTLSRSFAPPERSTSHLLSMASALFCRNTGMPARRISGGLARRGGAPGAFLVFPSTINCRLFTPSFEGSTSATLRPNPLLPSPPVPPLPLSQRAIIFAPRHPASPVPLRRLK